ncbi:methionyl-tRNA formyltransferase, mitochondrial-like isoform X3 [Oculina patagonica]
MRSLVRSLSTANGTCKPPWKILFFGTDRFAVHPLKALNENKRTSGSIVKLIDVVCPPERRRVIKKPLNGETIDTAREFSIKHDIPIHYWHGKEGWQPNQGPPDPYDIAVVASFGYLIPNHVLDMFPCGAINIHPSLLPQWKGAAPMSHAILSGAKETGVSIVEVSRDRFDAGESLLQETFKIPEDIMYDDLSDQLAILGTKMLMYTLENLESLRKNPAKPLKQMKASWARRLTKEVGYIDWTYHTWSYIRRRWNALSSRVGVQTSWEGKKVKLIKMSRSFFLVSCAFSLF